MCERVKLFLCICCEFELLEYINLFLNMPFIVHRDFKIKLSEFACGQK